MGAGQSHSWVSIWRNAHIGVATTTKPAVAASADSSGQATALKDKLLGKVMPGK